MSLTRLTVRSTRALARQSAFTTSKCARFNSTAAAASESSSNAAPASEPVDPKISTIVDQISQLNLLETSKLVTELKSRLNIPDISFPAAGAAAPAAPAAAPAEEEAAEPVQEKTIFTLKLESFDAKSKPKVIKEVKNLLGLSLVDSKKLVEGAPKTLKENVTKDDAEKIKEAMEKAGAKIAME